MGLGVRSMIYDAAALDMDAVLGSIHSGSFEEAGGCLTQTYGDYPWYVGQ